jgi:hypothetical protein
VRACVCVRPCVCVRVRVCECMRVVVQEWVRQSKLFIQFQLAGTLWLYREEKRKRIGSSNHSAESSNSESSNSESSNSESSNSESSNSESSNSESSNSESSYISIKYTNYTLYWLNMTQNICPQNILLLWTTCGHLNCRVPSTLLGEDKPKMPQLHNCSQPCQPSVGQQRRPCLFLEFSQNVSRSPALIRRLAVAFLSLVILQDLLCQVAGRENLGGLEFF